jgi:3-isopropylmalate/(R)-2-methylmalate dehydratase large subunit
MTQRQSAPRTLLDKLWEGHLVATREGQPDQIYVDLHLIHEVTSPQAFEGLRLAGRTVRRPDLTLATIDHAVPTEGRSEVWADERAIEQVEVLRKNCADFGVPLFDIDDDRQGIVHVVGPEQGLTQPGMVVVCGDSHTATHGAFGALAFGIGTSEVEHVLATQTLVQHKPKSLAVEFTGALPEGLDPKDLTLAVIAALGAAGGRGHAIEFRGEAIAALDMEGRMTLCNMAIEAGARAGLIAPDQVTFDWIEGRPFAPAPEQWEYAKAQWRELHSDEEAVFDRVVELDVSKLSPVVTWGTSPDQSAPLRETVPRPESVEDPRERAALERALAYMDLEPGMPLAAISIDRVFIGSCTNGRLADLRRAANLLRGRKVAPGVQAMVVPGSGLVKRAAEAEGLDQVFLSAGCQWREPGCSMCLGMNPDKLASGERCASTSNRNFEGRQGPGGRTHLVSPAVAAASAITGRLTDPSELHAMEAR